MAEVWVRYFHFLGIIAVGATLVAEHLLLKAELTPKEIRRLARIDAIYGLSALLVLAMGLTLWFVVGKPAVFYNHNGIFHAKVSLFLIVALLSIYPTIFFIKNRSSDQNILVPKKIIMLIRIELLILAILPLLAALMAKGIGTRA